MNIEPGLREFLGRVVETRSDATQTAYTIEDDGDAFPPQQFFENVENVASSSLLSSSPVITNVTSIKETKPSAQSSIASDDDCQEVQIIIKTEGECLTCLFQER